MLDFGAFVKEIRERKGLSLREFCRLANLDPGNWSKVERGIFPPPRNRDSIADIATVLLLAQDSEEWKRLFELAAVGHIPSGLLAEPSVGERISVFFRLNRRPDWNSLISDPGGRRGADDKSMKFAKDAFHPKLKSATKPSGKPISKPGSIRSSKGGRGR